MIKHIVVTADALAKNEGVTHWALSMRLTGKGNFLHRLSAGRDCHTGTYEAVMRKLSAMWPIDLEWPADIPRPPTKKGDTA